MMDRIDRIIHPGGGLHGRTVLTVGGDARMLNVARSLTAAGAHVRAVGMAGAAGLPDGVRLYRSLSRAAEGLSCGEAALVLPLPVTRDGTHVWCPLDAECDVTLDSLTSLCAACRAGGGVPSAVGGQLPTAWRDALTAAGARVVDYAAGEAFLTANARLTAEGALMLAAEQTPFSFFDTSAAVIGYGRVGRALGRLLRAVGVRVTVFARRAEARAEAAGDGCAVCPLTENTFRAALGGTGEGAVGGPLTGDPAVRPAFDVIFNTVPARLLTGPLRGDAGQRLYMELASAPGAADPASLRAAGLRVVCAPSLPARYAPATAGRLLADAVLDTLGDAVCAGGDRE